MDSWHATFLGLRHLPHEIAAFEIEVFFRFSTAERRVIEERRRPELKLGLALQIGFLRMSGRLLEAIRIVPPLLWRHLGSQFGVADLETALLKICGAPNFSSGSLSASMQISASIVFTPAKRNPRGRRYPRCSSGTDNAWPSAGMPDAPLT
ncbi:MAG: DUF4158 domain-containing protein [Steroidobacteraceae bacterium]